LDTQGHLAVGFACRRRRIEVSEGRILAADSKSSSKSKLDSARIFARLRGRTRAALTVNAPPLGIALVRIGVGALLLLEAQRLLAAGVGPSLIENSAHRIALAPGALAWFGEEVALRFPAACAWSLVAATFGVGASYFVGAFTRPANAVLLLLALWTWSFDAYARREYALLLALCALGCGLADAGRRLGLDESLAQRAPVWLTWSRGKRSRR